MLEGEYRISLVCIFLRTYPSRQFYTKEFYALQSVIIMVLYRENGCRNVLLLLVNR